MVARHPPHHTRPGPAQGATIGGIIRGNETILPTRDTQIKAKDKVVIFALPKAMEQVSKLFD